MISKIIGTHAWTKNDTSLLSDLDADQQQAVHGWITGNLCASTNTVSGHSSYGIKHILEYQIGIHMTNNQFKDAMLKCGFRPVSAKELNWRYWLHRRSPAFISQHGTKPLFPCMTPEDESNPTFFYGWMMRTHLKDKSPAGDLALDMLDDMTWPHTNTHAVIARYLDYHGACSGCKAAFEKCWREYKADKEPDSSASACL